MKADSPTPSQRALPVVVRTALTALADEAPPDEREFSARLHRRLVAAGAPPTPSWLGRLREIGLELWRTFGHDTPQKRSLLTGAILGALATATAFLLLSGLRGASPERPGDETSSLVDTGDPSGATGGAEHKGQHAVGDRRPTRDRLGEDIGAERPERLRVEPARPPGK
jgi:hypothetical protein